MTDIEFQQAIMGVAAGDKNSLKLIYQDYVSMIYITAYDKLKNKENAEDITSEFFIKLIRVAPSFKQGSPHKAWLITIVRNMCIDFLRKTNREIAYSGYEDEEDDRTIEDKFEELNFANRESNLVENKIVLAEDMKKAMTYLNDAEREIINMRLLGEIKFKDIAAQLNKSIGTVTWIYNQGIKKIRRCLNNYVQ